MYILCVQAVMTPVIMCICPDSPDSSLLNNALSAKILHAGSTSFNEKSNTLA